MMAKATDLIQMGKTWYALVICPVHACPQSQNVQEAQFEERRVIAHLQGAASHLDLWTS